MVFREIKSFACRHIKKEYNVLLKNFWVRKGQIYLASS
jgi:hypothetical protein